MAMEVMKFAKTMEQRLEEYMEILDDKSLKASEVVEQLHYFVELTVEPAGWLALWKIPKRKCEELKIGYPSVVFVMVKDVNFRNLAADVEILAVQDDIKLNDVEEAQLINLYPTKRQDYFTVDAAATADHLDKLRFFHHHIWLPWDQDNGSTEWPTTVLIPRIQLHYDLAHGQIPHQAAKHIHLLFEEARELGQRRKMLEEQKGDGDDDDVDENSLYELVQLHKRLEVIKSEIEILQYPELRNPIINKIKEKAKEEAASIRMVLNSGKIDDLIKILTDAKSAMDPKADIRSYPSLHCALDLATPGDTVVLCPGQHSFQNIEALEQGGTIKGFSEPSSTVIITQNAGQIMLQCAGPTLCLENLTINAQSLLTVLAVKQGTVQLKRCDIVGNKSSSIIQCAVVSEIGNLEATGCNICGFGVGVIVESGGKVVLNNCSITNCMIGIKVLDNASLTLNHCSVSNCLEYGVKFMTKKSGSTYQAGSIALLEGIQEVKYDDLVLEGNKKGDVIVLQCPEDLLSDEDVELY